MALPSITNVFSPCKPNYTLHSQDAGLQYPYKTTKLGVELPHVEVSSFGTSQLLADVRDSDRFAIYIQSRGSFISSSLQSSNHCFPFLLQSASDESELLSLPVILWTCRPAVVMPWKSHINTQSHTCAKASYSMQNVLVCN